MTARRRAPTTVTLLTVAVAVLIILSAMQLYVARRASHESVTISSVLLLGLATWVGWALAAPVILALGRRFDFRRGHRWTSAAVHAGFFVACYVPIMALVLFAGNAVWGDGRGIPFAAIVQQVFASTRLQLGLLIYVVVFGLGRAMSIWDALRERELQASRLEAQAAEARLQALAARLHPHFLFNTLHAIGALVDEDPPRARAMMAQLGELLRDVLAEPATQDISLREEIVLLRRYLDVEQIRFADRLRVEQVVPLELLAARVPRFLLQPLAENALRHGIAPRARGGVLRITARQSNGSLRLSVWNDGVPLTAERPERLGLATTRERLATRYGQAANLQLRSADGGVEAVIDLPLEVTAE